MTKTSEAEQEATATIALDVIAARRVSLMHDLQDGQQAIAETERDLANMRAAEQRVRGAIAILDELLASASPVLDIDAIIRARANGDSPVEGA